MSEDVSQSPTASQSRPRRYVDTVRQWIVDNRVPLGVFIITRLGLVLTVYLVLGLLPINTSPIALDAGESFTASPVLAGWVRWDSAYYLSIADHGYTADQPTANGIHLDTGFFPLYPIAIRLLAEVIGNLPLSGLLISNVCFLLALLLLYRMATAWFDADVARRAIILLAVFPFSFYFTAAYSESLFLLLTLGAFYLAERDDRASAAICAALASATHPPGVLLFIGLVVMYAEKRRFQWRRIDRNVLWLPVSLAGILSFMAFLWIRFGNPVLFVSDHLTAQVGVTRQVTTIVPRLAEFVNQGSGSISGKVTVAVFLLAVFLIVIAWRRMPYKAYAIWCAANLALGLPKFGGLGRYVLILFPLFVAGALLLNKPTRFQAVLYVSTLVLSIFAAMFGLWYLIG